VRALDDPGHGGRQARPFESARAANRIRDPARFLWRTGGDGPDKVVAVSGFNHHGWARFVGPGAHDEARAEARMVLGLMGLRPEVCRAVVRSAGFTMAG